MGQQQLLLIVLGVIIVGVAVITAIILFRASAVENKRDLILNELMNIAMMAQEYNKKPTILGGGVLSGRAVPVVGVGGGTTGNVDRRRPSACSEAIHVRLRTHA